MKKPGFKHLLTFTTMLIAGSAAFFSVWGIGKLFAGAAVSTMVMAASLELGKIVAVTFLYRYWERIKLFFRTYLVLGALLLMIITSGGIYGYLSSAYATSALSFQSQRGEITLLETRQNSLTTTYNSNTERIRSNDDRIRQLQQYRAQQENRLDSLMGRGGFTTQQNIVRQADAEIRRLQTENRTIEGQNIGLLTSKDSLQQVKLTKETASNTDSKLGTFWYIAEAIGVPLDTVVKWFILMIVLVFDPLSIALVVAYNVIKKEEDEEPEGKPPAPPPASPPPDDKTATLADTINWETVPTVKMTETVESSFDEPPVEVPASANLPYYLQPNFDWNNKELWVHDPDARGFHEQASKSRG